MMAPSRTIVKLGFALSALPLLFLIGMVSHYGFDAPFQDSWELVPVLEKTYAGTLTLHDLWTQHNEHRLIFPKAVMLILARLTDWNQAYEWAVTILCALAAFLGLLVQFARTQRKVPRPEFAAVIPLLSLMVFSLSQWQVWLWGWELQVYMNVAAVTLCIVLLGGSAAAWRSLIGAALLGVVATYSFANGLLIWPIGLMLVWGLAPESAALWKKRLLFWVVCGAATSASFLYHYQRPSYNPPWQLVLEHPLRYVQYVITYMGGAAVTWSVWGASISGVIGLVVIIYTLWRVHPTGTVRCGTLGPYLGLAAYALGSALLTGMGRFTDGPGQALSSRYIPVSTLFWVAVVASLLLLLSILRSPWPARATLLAVAGLVMLGQLYGCYCADERSDAFEPARAALLRGGDDPVLGRLHPRLEVIHERTPFLRQHHLSVFRDLGPTILEDRP